MDDNALKYFAIANLGLSGLQNVVRSLRGQPTSGIDNSPLFLLLKQQEENRKRQQAERLGQALSSGLPEPEAQKIREATLANPEYAARAAFPKPEAEVLPKIVVTSSGAGIFNPKDPYNPDGTPKFQIVPETRPSPYQKLSPLYRIAEDGRLELVPGAEEALRAQARAKNEGRPPSPLEEYAKGMQERDAFKANQELLLNSIKSFQKENENVPKAYQDQQKVYNTIQELNRVLSGQNTGLLTREINYINKLAKELGVSVDHEKIGKLDTARQLAGELTIRYMKEFGGNDTEEERQFVEQMQPSDLTNPVGRKMAEYIAKRRLETAKFENRLVKEGEALLRQGEDPLRVQDYMDLKREEHFRERQQTFNPEKDIKITKEDLAMIKNEQGPLALQALKQGEVITFEDFLRMMRGEPVFKYKDSK